MFTDIYFAFLNEGAIDPASLLEQIELQIGKVKEEAYSRKEILDKVEKWLSACEEENWLEEYNNVDLISILLVSCFFFHFDYIPN